MRASPNSHYKIHFETPSDEGTWGHSSEYIYFWTPEGQYIQWSGPYIYSNSPIRLANEPLVLSVGNPTRRVVPWDRQSIEDAKTATGAPPAAEPTSTVTNTKP